MDTAVSWKSYKGGTWDLPYALCVMWLMAKWLVRIDKWESLCEASTGDNKKKNSKVKKEKHWSLSSHSGPMVNFICEWLGVNDSDSFLIVSYISFVTVACVVTIAGGLAVVFGLQSCKLPFALWWTCAVTAGPGCLIHDSAPCYCKKQYIYKKKMTGPVKSSSALAKKVFAFSLAVTKNTQKCILMKSKLH